MNERWKKILDANLALGGLNAVIGGANLVEGAQNASPAQQAVALVGIGLAGVAFGHSRTIATRESTPGESKENQGS